MVNQLKLSSVLDKGNKHQQFRPYELHTTPSQISDHCILDAEVIQAKENCHREVNWKRHICLALFTLFLPPSRYLSLCSFKQFPKTLTQSWEVWDTPILSRSPFKLNCYWTLQWQKVLRKKLIIRTSKKCLKKIFNYRLNTNFNPHYYCTEIWAE